jgi:hypothetical protein
VASEDGVDEDWDVPTKAVLEHVLQLRADITALHWHMFEVQSALAQHGIQRNPADPGEAECILAFRNRLAMMRQGYLDALMSDEPEPDPPNVIPFQRKA